MENVFIDRGYLHIKRKSYSWKLNNIRYTLGRLEYNVISKRITYIEYQECILLLLKGGLI